jgi:hypothetical protein
MAVQYKQKRYRQNRRTPPGPLAGLWSWQYYDVRKMLGILLSPTVKSYYKMFPKILPLGSQFPEIELKIATGGKINTKQLQGKKHFVLFTGSIT